MDQNKFTFKSPERNTKEKIGSVKSTNRKTNRSTYEKTTSVGYSPNVNYSALVRNQQKLADFQVEKTTFGLRTRSVIEKENPELTKRRGEDDLYKKKRNSVAKTRMDNHMFRRNPLTLMSPQKGVEYLEEERDQKAMRTARVNGYMDSTRLKKFLSQKGAETSRENPLWLDEQRKNQLMSSYKEGEKKYRQNKNHIVFPQDNVGTYIR